LIQQNLPKARRKASQNVEILRKKRQESMQFHCLAGVTDSESAAEQRRPRLNLPIARAGCFNRIIETGVLHAVWG
jgi:hypothetical protein